VFVINRDALFKRAKTKAKKKPRKRSDSSGGYNLSDIIQSPASTGQWERVSGIKTEHEV